MAITLSLRKFWGVTLEIKIESRFYDKRYVVIEEYYFHKESYVHLQYIEAWFKELGIVKCFE